MGCFLLHHYWLVPDQQLHPNGHMEVMLLTLICPWRQWGGGGGCNTPVTPHITTGTSHFCPCSITEGGARPSVHAAVLPGLPLTPSTRNRRQ